MRSGKGETGMQLPAYPINMSLFLEMADFTPDAAGEFSFVQPAGYNPTAIGEYALTQWNCYLINDDEKYKRGFLAQAYWLVEHETRIGEHAGGWPESLERPDYYAVGPILSALTQGCSLSVLLRAYQLTGEEKFLKAIKRVLCTFELDILDGGISTPVGKAGFFFEEIAVYPAAHMLCGFVIALLGLYEYVACFPDQRVKGLIRHSHDTMHILLQEFDTGFWTYFDLLYRQLSSPAQLALQAISLKALVTYTSCDRCARLALRWDGYKRSVVSRLRYKVSHRLATLRHAAWSRLQSALFPRPRGAGVLRVCIPVNAFPVTGGIRTVLAAIAQVTSDTWQIEYLTRTVGQHPEGYVIHRFGASKLVPWQFPMVWLYVLAGGRKLLSLMRKGACYDVILPQDGVGTAVLAALAGKIAGARVVCIDHSNMTLLYSNSYRIERIQGLAKKRWWYRWLMRSLLVGYWPSAILLARIAARLVDHFVIPGIAGDGVEEICNQLGVPPSRITRFANMVNIERHVILDATARALLRKKNDIATDAIVITMICRLSPEKGLDIALESISQVLATLQPDLRLRVRVIIAGQGILYSHLEEEIAVRGLSQTCILWGEATETEVITLLSLSDIFLYTSKRGAGYPMAILEAMASCCAVVASTEPLANAHLLSEGRGISVPVEGVAETSLALVQLISNPELRCQMGRLAREYVKTHHSEAMFRRVWMRATCWAALNEILDARHVAHLQGAISDYKSLRVGQGDD